MTEQTNHILVFDASNILYKSFHANERIYEQRTKYTAPGLDADDEGIPEDVQKAGLAHHLALSMFNKYYKQCRPDQVVLCFDRSNWRKVYTKSDQCLSGAVYKGNRRQDMTPAQQEVFARFCEHINEFETIIREHTGIVSLAADSLEADDLIAGVVQEMSPETKITIVSADKDLLQLLRYDNVVLLDPTSGQPRSLSDYNYDADYFIFHKCMRGDQGDNVRSALPRVRTTRLEKAYKDPFEYDSLMKTEWTNEEGKQMVVGKLFQENKKLMDLTCQPEEIKELIKRTVIEGFANPGSFNHFKFVKFCGRYQLRKVVEQLHVYMDLLV